MCFSNTPSPFSTSSSAFSTPPFLSLQLLGYPPPLLLPPPLSLHTLYLFWGAGGSSVSALWDGRWRLVKALCEVGGSDVGAVYCAGASVWEAAGASKLFKRGIRASVLCCT